jgi:quercetin dioxygenase-like cupin family protein
MIVTMTTLVLLLLAQQPPLPSTVFDWTQLAVKKTAKGERRDIVNRPTATFTNFESHVTTIGPGEEAHPAHVHADEEIIIVKEGTLEAAFDGKTQRAPAGSLLFFAANQRHGMRNVGNTAATYYVIRIITKDTPPAKPQ